METLMRQSVKSNNGIKIWTMLVTAFSVLLLVLPGQISAAQNHIRIVMNPQNGAGGASEIFVVPGGAMPDITPPTRRGYTFLGYWSGASGKGEQYYDEAGRALRPCGFTDTAALYAFWKVRTYAVIYENMAGAVIDANTPLTHTYGLNTRIPDPVKAGYTFFGWQINGSTIASRGLTLGAGAYDADITLSAVWNKAALVTLVDNATETVTMHDEDLRQVFQRQVTDAQAGVTAADLNSEEVLLTLYASDADEQAQGAEDILSLAQGEVLKFYDFSVTKSVTKEAGSGTVTTSLHELPNTVQVEITLGAAIRGRQSYRVYRYHNGRAEPIPMGLAEDPEQKKESFELSADGTILKLHTRRLSTYAVVGGEKILGGSGTVEEGAAEVDVQARVKEGGDGPVYKVDIVWGPMQFTYSTGRSWDTVEHRYTDVRIYDWIPAECYSGGNNRITVYNHSNADVAVDFAVFPLLKEGADTSLMDGVDMTVNQTNTADGPPAAGVFLTKVPGEGEPAPCINGYLRLNGSPTDPEFYKGLVTDEEGYVKVAGIAVTITHLDGPRTPKRIS